MHGLRAGCCVEHVNCRLPVIAGGETACWLAATSLFLINIELHTVCVYPRTPATGYCIPPHAPTAMYTKTTLAKPFWLDGMVIVSLLFASQSASLLSKATLPAVLGLCVGYHMPWETSIIKYRWSLLADALYELDAFAAVGLQVPQQVRQYLRGPNELVHRTMQSSARSAAAPDGNDYCS